MTTYLTCRPGDLLRRRAGQSVGLYTYLSYAEASVGVVIMDDLAMMIGGPLDVPKGYCGYIYVITLGPHPRLGWASTNCYEHVLP